MHLVMSIRSEDDTADQEPCPMPKTSIGNPGEVWKDVLSEKGNRVDRITNANGDTLFSCRGMSVGYFARRTETDRFPL